MGGCRWAVLLRLSYAVVPTCAEGVAYLGFVLVRCTWTHALNPNLFTHLFELVGCG